MCREIAQVTDIAIPSQMWLGNFSLDRDVSWSVNRLSIMLTALDCIGQASRPCAGRLTELWKAFLNLLCMTSSSSRQKGQHGHD